jgi:hypothetical protein
MESSAAIDQNVLGASFGDDHTAIDALWKNFQETAGEAEQGIDVASCTGDFIKLAVAAYNLKGAAQALGCDWRRC